MCGLTGVAGKLTGETDKILKNLLIVDSLRGVDSTGIAAIDRNEDVRVVKQVGDPFRLFESKRFDQALCKMNRAIIGHNRWATQGAVSNKNAHPFEFDTLVGVHNGTLFNKHKLADSNQFTVDSENLFHHLEKEGLKSLMDVIDGAWSLVWWDKIEQTLNFLRNKERPMFITTSLDDSIIAWASEPWMLEGVVKREKLVWNDVVSTKVDTLYSFHINEKAELQKPHIRDSIAKSSLIPVHRNQNWHKQRNFHNGGLEKTGNDSGPPFQMATLPAVIGKPDNVSITPTGKVVVFPSKNSQVVPHSHPKRQTLSVKRLAPSSNDLYKERKNVLLEILSKQRDQHGAEYWVCFDPENRTNFIRLYIKKTDKVDLQDKEILCSIGNRFVDDKEGFYYKVDHGSVKLSPLQMKFKELNEDIATIEKESAGKYFMDGRGKLISQTDWNLEYNKGCSWCTAPVFPEEPNRFTVEGDIICPDCAVDSEIEKYVNLRK